VTADRSTEEGWLRKLEKVADDEDDDFAGRARIFRDILAKAWADGWERGYADRNDDHWRADSARRQAEREAATEKETST
jgi:hypothetical protein